MADGGVLDFGKAMSDFRIMFPDMDSDVIEAVLRAHGGEVDPTIDHLLAMNTSVTSENSCPSEPPMEDLIQLGPSLNVEDTILDPLKMDERQPSISLPPPPAAAGNAKGTLAYTHPERASEEESSSSKASGVVPTQTMLQNRYEENLRNRERVRSSGETSLLSQYLEDERVALMLQNEEFMAELRRDAEFISTLESESLPPAPSVSPRTPKMGSSMDEAVFREKLKNMGKTSKKKFSMLASMFSRRKSIARTMLGNTSTPSNDSLLLDAESFEDDDESEDERRKPSTGGHSMFKSKGGGKYSSFS